MSSINFQYAEAGAPDTFATSFAGQLPFFKPEAWLTGPSTMQPGAAKGVDFLLRGTADPSSAYMTLIAKSLSEQAKDTEPIYGTRTGTAPLAREVDTWRTDPISANLAPPKPNPFIPTDFSLKCDSAAAAGALSRSVPPAKQAPVLLGGAGGARLHFLQDARFRRPKGSVVFLLRTPQLTESAGVAIRGQLFQALLSDALQDSTYQAALAGLGAGVSCDVNGVTVSASGYSDRIPELVGLVGSQVRSFEISEIAFGRRLETLRQSLANFKLRMPVSLCSYYRGMVLEYPKFTVAELEAEAKALTLMQMRTFQQQLCPQANVEGLVCGNFDEAQARLLLSRLTDALPTAPLPDGTRLRRLVRKLPVGARVQQFVAANADESNSAVEVYFQVGPDKGDTWLLLVLLSQILEQPYYEELRTNQQLGYIVQSGVTETEGVRGLSCLIQSTEQPPPELERRIDAVLATFRDTLVTMPETELTSYKEALAAQSLDVDKRLAQQSGRFWGEIVQQRYDYGRPWRVAKRVRQVSRDQLIDHFDNFFAPNAPKLRRLSTHVYAQASAPASLLPAPPDSSDFWPPPRDMLLKV